MGPTLRVFVTSATFTGDFGGQPGTDAACQKAATDAALGGTWRAWTGGSAGTPDSRFTHGPNPYVLVGGAQIAADWTDLTDGTLAAPIDHDEHGAAVTAMDLVWTGVGANGKSLQPNCNDWVGQTGTHYGSMHDTTSAWSDAGAIYCPSAMPGRLFCFEQ
jgi:hypothetical protein